MGSTPISRPILRKTYNFLVIGYFFCLVLAIVLIIIRLNSLVVMPLEIVNIPLKAKYVAMRPSQWNSSGDAWAAAQIEANANTFMNESPKAQ